MFHTANTAPQHITRPIGFFPATILVAFAAMALTACGGGTDEEAAREPVSLPVLEKPANASTVTMTKVNFTNASGQALTGFLFRDSMAVSRNAAVVMMHGCNGVWSNGVVSAADQPSIKALSHLHQRWGESVAKAGFVGLLVDSFTARNLPSECNNGAGGLNEAVERPKDALAGRNWLIQNGHVASHRVALLGWSNGASAVMATMDRTNEGSVGARPFREAFAFYPGCGLINEFGGNAATLDKTTWLPYAPVSIYHASTDPLYTSGQCDNRITKAIQLGAGPGSDNSVAMTVYAGARHSFDLINVNKAIAAPYTASDKDAQLAADPAILARLNALFSH